MKRKNLNLLLLEVHPEGLSEDLPEYLQGVVAVLEAEVVVGIIENLVAVEILKVAVGILEVVIITAVGVLVVLVGDRGVIAEGSEVALVTEKEEAHSIKVSTTMEHIKKFNT